jgi:hypothetical protein
MKPGLHPNKAVAQSIRKHAKQQTTFLQISSASVVGYDIVYKLHKKFNFSPWLGIIF